MSVIRYRPPEPNGPPICVSPRLKNDGWVRETWSDSKRRNRARTSFSPSRNDYHMTTCLTSKGRNIRWTTLSRDSVLVHRSRSTRPTVGSTTETDQPWRDWTCLSGNVLGGLVWDSPSYVSSSTTLFLFVTPPRPSFYVVPRLDFWGGSKEKSVERKPYHSWRRSTTINVTDTGFFMGWSPKSNHVWGVHPFYSSYETEDGEVLVGIR